ncbi:MAG TPA: ATP-binding protein [Candidatus Baltobacteraceae bacterium]|jgi:anti-sigma regulatory factor (Ser/Thr protein kinase)|nr:ATP-binding protein [Candidatus Baltobacteraceae bacterium]
MPTAHHTRRLRDKKPSIQLRIPPDPRFARTVRDAVTGFASLHHVHDDDLEALLFAIGEALANAIEHSRATGDVEVRVEIDQSLVLATVSDRGDGIAHLPVTRAPLPQPLSERGRGIPIMQRCVDTFRVDRLPEGGTTVTLGRLRRERGQEPHIAS